MNEGLFYALFFTGTLINYAVKLNLESRGHKLACNSLREGATIIVWSYLFYPAGVSQDVHPGQSLRLHTQHFLIDQTLLHPFSDHSKPWPSIKQDLNPLPGDHP